MFFCKLWNEILQTSPISLKYICSTLLWNLNKSGLHWPCNNFACRSRNRKQTSDSQVYCLQRKIKVQFLLFDWLLICCWKLLVWQYPICCFQMIRRRLYFWYLQICLGSRIGERVRQLHPVVELVGEEEFENCRVYWDDVDLVNSARFEAFRMADNLCLCSQGC